MTRRSQSSHDWDKAAPGRRKDCWSPMETHTQLAEQYHVEPPDGV